MCYLTFSNKRKVSATDILGKYLPDESVALEEEGWACDKRQGRQVSRVKVQRSFDETCDVISLQIPRHFYDIFMSGQRLAIVQAIKYTCNSLLLIHADRHPTESLCESLANRPPAARSLS